MKLETAIKEYLIEIEIRKYTPKTIRGYKSNLYLFLHFIQKDTPEIDDLTLADVRRFTKYMVDRGNKGTYINGILKTLKSFIQYCYEEGYGGFNTKKSFKWCKEEKPVILAYKPKDVRSMLKECGGSGYYDIRDKTIITMFIETGIRNSELCNIKPEDIHNDFILINGKNHKQRVVPVTPILKKAMVKYDREKEKYFAIRQIENYYFLSRTGRRLTPEANENILKKRGSEICGVRVSPHTCRHFYAQQQLQMGTDLYTISRLLGHENIQITQTYLNSLRDEEIIESNKTRSVILNMGQSLNETNPFLLFFFLLFLFLFCRLCPYLLDVYIFVAIIKRGIESLSNNIHGFHRGAAILTNQLILLLDYRKEILWYNNLLSFQIQRNLHPSFPPKVKIVVFQFDCIQIYIIYYFLSIERTKI